MLHFNSITGIRSHRLVALVFAFLLVGFVSASATFSTDYLYQFGTGTATDMSGSSLIPTTSDDDGAQTAAPYEIGFTFLLDNIPATHFSVNSNGLIKLGGTPVVSGTRFNEDFPSFGPTADHFPFIAPFWDDLYSHGDKIRYKLTGTAPNRVLVIEYHTEKYSFNNLEDLRMQVRLYETSNKIEFLYVTFTTQPGFNTFNGLIGLATSTGNYVRVVPGATPQFLTSGSGTVTPPTAGTMYTFVPCQRNVDIVGSVPQGGTVGMASGDSLMTGIGVQRGNSGSYTPFTVSLGGFPCASRNFNIAISGPAAADYQIVPTTGTLGANGSQAITVNFTPQAVGRRNATLTVADNNGLSRTYYLGARGLTRIQFVPDTAQGGTMSMAQGDTLMRYILVPRRTSQNFTPFTIRNINTNGSAPGAPINLTILGSSSGQYSVSPTTATLASGQDFTPVITFSPMGSGPIIDTIFVDADGELYTFVLGANALAPGIAIYDVTAPTTPIDSNSLLFVNRTGCAGEEFVTYELEVDNIGFGILRVFGADFYLTDTAYGQGVPPYPMLRDGQGNLIPSSDYILTTAPPVLPLSASQQNFPLVIPAGGTGKLYLTLVGQHPGKRFARAYLRTNAENVTGTDIDGNSYEGLVPISLFGRAVGSRLADAAGKLPTAVTFPPTYIDESSTATLTLHNPGVCTLRVSNKFMDIVAGDVDEFEIVAKPNQLMDNNTGDVLIAPGATDVITLRFTPTQQGSRRAGLRLMTNDSTIHIPGVTERGVYYIDLFGTGRADLYAENVDFGTVLIGGDGSEQHTDKITLKNTRTEPITVKEIIVEGTDMADFVQNGWPTMPRMINPGEEIDLGVTFAPMGGQPGERNTTVKLVTASGDTIRVTLRGVAGTRTISVTPTTVNFGTLSSGKVSRRMVMVTNTGTMPVKLDQPTGLQTSPEFSNTPLARLDLAPGQTEYIEVTYRPTTAGASEATMVISGNQTGGNVDVKLQATAVKTRQNGGNPSESIRGRETGELGNNELDNADDLSLSGVESDASASGMLLGQSMPNPARDLVTISYTLVKGGEATLALYDANGRLVRVLDAGQRGMGEQTVRVDVRDLASGRYYYRLTSGGETISRTLNIVK